MATGSVTGNVVFGDTHQPARFARVLLEPVPGEKSAALEIQATTLADGTFTVHHVAPGNYYVQAYVPGYLSQRAWEQSQVDAGIAPADVLAQISVVHVEAGASSAPPIVLQQGGAVSGRLQWEDGSPAIGISVSLLPIHQSKPLPPALQSVPSLGPSGVSETDDRGAYRLIGTPEGDYLVQAAVGISMQFSGSGKANSSFQYQGGTTVYAPGVFRKSEASPISVHLGEEQSGVNMTIDLTQLHSLSGSVTWTTPGQTISSGTVVLLSKSDPELQRSASIDSNGGFVLSLVPKGDYTLIITDARTQAPSTGNLNKGRTIHFKQLQQPVTVGDTDITDLALTLQPESASQ